MVAVTIVVSNGTTETFNEESTEWPSFAINANVRARKLEAGGTVNGVETSGGDYAVEVGDEIRIVSGDLFERLYSPA